MSQPGTEMVPAILEHSCTVYRAMLAEATTDEETGQKVYEGHLTRLFAGLRFSTPYYTVIKNAMVAMGCIEQVRRGGGGGLSKWILWTEPSIDLWAQRSLTKSHRATKQDMQQQQIRDLGKRMEALEVKIDAFIASLKTVIDRNGR